MSLLPLRGESTADPDEPRVVGLGGQEADEAFEVLSSATTRRVLAFLYEQPSTPAEVRDEVGTSLQNVHYHIKKLEEAGLIEAAGTGYSEKGTEMTIYAPRNEALVLFAGKRGDESLFRQLLARVFGPIVALFLGTVALQAYLGDLMLPFFSAGAPAAGGGDAAAAGEAATTTTQTAGSVGIASSDAATTTAAKTTAAAMESARVAGEAAAGIDPALAFLLGGLLVLVVVTAVWYVSDRRAVR